MDRIVWNDIEEQQLRSELTEFLEGEHSVDIFVNSILNDPPPLDKNESISSRQVIPRFPPGVVGMLILSKRYSINIKLTTLALLAFILDLHVTKGAALLLLGLTGKTKQAITALSPNERCILKYILQSKKRYMDLEGYFAEMSCKFPDIRPCPLWSDERCTYTRERIKGDLNALLARGVLARKSKGLCIAF